MNFHGRFILGMLAVSGALVLPLPAFAQAAPAAAAQPTPAKTAAAAKKGAAAKKDTLELARPEDIAVEAVLAAKPTTPLECAKAAKILADLGRPDLGKPLLKKVLDAKLPPEDLAKLGAELGPAAILSLTNYDGLAPEGRQLADAIATAVAAERTAAERITDLIAQLQDDAVEKRYQAMIALQEVPRAALGPLVQVLADPARAVEYANVRTTLAGMGRLGRQALVEVLPQVPPPLAVQIVKTLAEMRSPTVELALLAPALAEQSDPDVRQAAQDALLHWCVTLPSQSAAVSQLSAAAKNCFEHKQLLELTGTGALELWQWDADRRLCIAMVCQEDDVFRALAARWARDAYLLAPANHDLDVLYLTTLLEAAQYKCGLDRPLEKNAPAAVEAQRLGVGMIDAALALALTDRSVPCGRVGAALAAARLLGQLGTAQEVLYQGAEVAPLARAVRHPDRRVRLAALQAIVRLCPLQPYAGSSAVPAALAYFIRTNGRRRAIAAAPNVQEASKWAGMLAAQGWGAEHVGTGRSLLQTAAASPDYELALIDVSIGHPDIGILLQQLRRDERTATLRVGLIARAGYLELAERMARSDPLSLAFARPTDDQALQWQLEQLGTLAPHEFVAFETRQQEAAAALELLDQLTCECGKLYDLQHVREAVLTAVNVPHLQAKAIAVLANTNSAESQQALVELASRLTLPLEARCAAAAAFRKNSAQFGLLLTTDEIRRQYERYNDSEKMDAGTQRVLGLLLDCIEAPTAAHNAPQKK